MLTLGGLAASSNLRWVIFGSSQPRGDGVMRLLRNITGQQSILQRSQGLLRVGRG